MMRWKDWDLYILIEELPAKISMELFMWLKQEIFI